MSSLLSISSSSISVSSCSKLSVSHFKPNLKLPLFSSNTPLITLQKHPSTPTNLTKASTSFLTDFAADSTGDEDEEDDHKSPWEGALVYKRDAAVCHVEFVTTLERLGLGKLSSEVSRSRASAMGIRLSTVRSSKDSNGTNDTPVLVSVDVTRRKRRLKLDGVIKTVITLGCNRCAEPAAECLFSNFTLLLTEDPLEESDEVNMGVIFGEDKLKQYTRNNDGEEYDEELIDLDDRLYFPAEEKEIDISKYIRDMIHLEITINAICDPSCKGLCLSCGANLNKSRCSCNNKPAENEQFGGPLKGLRKQMQRT